MNWRLTHNEKAMDYAGAHHTYEHMSVQQNVHGHQMFVRGAKWQRDNLRTDDSVEMVALIMADVTGEPSPGRFERTMAKAAINALLGEEP